MDNGAHLLDACLWWLGDYASVEYKDDAQGLVEVECHLNLSLVNGASGSITMSRLRNLSNRIEVIGDKGKISMELGSGHINLMVGDEPVRLSGNATIDGARPEVNTLDLFEHQYRELYREITQGAYQVSTESADIVRGNDCLESIRLISQCYENRKALPFIAG